MNVLHTNIAQLRRFLADHPRLVVLSGAGISIASGIPAYRDREGVWRHSTPITHQEFIADPDSRARYWARSMLGWPMVRDARPNAAHLALAQLEQCGHIRLLITQNVDRLHQRAGSVAVVDLHGRVDQVRCIQCDVSVTREHIQRRLLRDNPGHARDTGQMRPDGDAEVDAERVATLSPPGCGVCGGTLIPDVVFFGGTVPRERVRRCTDALARSDALLVVGSSLQVFSGFRFCRIARELGKPLAIINPGSTRADDLAELKLEADCGPLLSALAAGLTALKSPHSYAAGNPS